MSTFLVLQTELADRLGAYDQTVAADATKLKRWLNMAQQYVCGKKRWPFMLASEIVQTVADYTTGTCTVAAAGTTVTFSAGITPTKANHYIQFASSDDWYKITAHTASASTATISPAAISANTDATYKIRKLHYTTTTPMIQILDIKQLISPSNLCALSPLESDFLLPLYSGTGTPSRYIMSVPNSSGTQQFSLYNSPDAVINLIIRGISALADLSADGDLSIIPSIWHDALVHIAAFYGFQGLDDTRAKTEFEAGEIRIDDMSRNYSLDPNRHRVMKSVDDQFSGLGWNLPPYNDYGS